MTQELGVVKGEPQELLPSQEPRKQEKLRQVSVQELLESLKSVSDDIGQISELSAEEKILVTQFFASLLRLMQPLSSSIAVSPLSVIAQVGEVLQAYIDPTGRLMLQFADGHFELKDLSEEKNRDLMMAVIGDIMPKFKNITSMYRRKLENRIKLLSSITKEIQKNSEALSAVI